MKLVGVIILLKIEKMNIEISPQTPCHKQTGDYGIHHVSTYILTTEQVK